MGLKSATLTESQACARPPFSKMSRGSSRMQEFYAGIPLRTRDGYNLGTLCIIDRLPRTLSHQDLRTLEDLAAIVMNDLEQRLQSRRSA